MAGNKKKHSALRIILLVLLLLVLAALIGGILFMMHYRQEYQMFQAAYNGRYFEGTTINGIDVSRMTSAEVEEKLSEQIDDYSLTLLFAEDKKESLSADDIGYVYVSSGEADRIVKAQDLETRFKDEFFHREIEKADYTVEVSTEYSKGLLESALYSLPELLESKMVKPEDCYIDFVDGKYVIVPEVEGTYIHKEVVLEAALAAADERVKELDVTKLEGAYEHPKKTVKSDSKKMQKTIDQLNNLTSSSVTWTLPNGETMTLDGTVTREWLKTEEDGSFAVDEEVWNAKITEFVGEIAAKVDNVGTPRVFNATGIGEVTVTDEGYGTYGNTVNQTREIEQLSEELRSGQQITREPIYSTWETADFNNGFGNSYVEIDLSRQHLWLYDGGEMKYETDVVSGTMTHKSHTPEGIYMVYAKEHNTKLIGEEDPETKKPTYEVPVKYWMPFIQELQIGLHDAKWRGEFGKDIYIYNGSNGCVNLPPKAAKKLDQLITWDMPVVVYYSQGEQLWG